MSSLPKLESNVNCQTRVSLIPRLLMLSFTGGKIPVSPLKRRFHVEVVSQCKNEQKPSEIVVTRALRDHFHGGKTLMLVTHGNDLNVFSACYPLL